MLPAIKWDNNRVIMIDQRKLPGKEIYVECTDYLQVAEAIEKMIIRGAPAIGVAAAYGVALGIMKVSREKDLTEELGQILSRLERTRPTARNLFWALKKMRNTFEENQNLPLSQMKKIMIQKALQIDREDVQTNEEIGSWGKELIKDGQSVLTHCNAGALATAGYGTALGVIKTAFKEGKRTRVYVSETRPFLQGARLTCWELDKEDIPFVLITDNMAGHFMQKGEISLVLTGADRIAKNGDTANKIGTYTLAVLAKEHGLPFYVTAPLNTVDFNLTRGSDIPIEERDAKEVKEIQGHCLTLPHIIALNPAFDVTPAKYISAIITEAGIARPPFKKSLGELERGTDR